MFSYSTILDLPRVIFLMESVYRVVQKFADHLAALWVDLRWQGLETLTGVPAPSLAL